MQEYIELAKQKENEIVAMLQKEARHYIINVLSERLEEQPSVVIPIKINGRLSRALGRYSYRGDNRSIEISRKLIAHDLKNDNDFKDTLDVLRHELIHYALHVNGLPYRDSDYYFQKTCNELGVGLSGTMTITQEAHVYKCDNGHTITRPRRIDETKYLCRCGAGLGYEGKKII